MVHGCCSTSFHPNEITFKMPGEPKRYIVGYEAYNEQLLDFPWYLFFHWNLIEVRNICCVWGHIYRQQVTYLIDLPHFLIIFSKVLSHFSLSRLNNSYFPNLSLQNWTCPFYSFKTSDLFPTCMAAEFNTPFALFITISHMSGVNDIQCREKVKPPSQSFMKVDLNHWVGAGAIGCISPFLGCSPRLHSAQKNESFWEDLRGSAFPILGSKKLRMPQFDWKIQLKVVLKFNNESEI